MKDSLLLISRFVHHTSVDNKRLLLTLHEIMAANITPLGLFSQVLLPNQPYELETLAADVQLTGISFGAEIAGENRASIKMTYFDRSTSNFGMGFDDSDDESDSDEEEYSEAAETDDDDDSGAVDEEALKKAIEEKSKKRNELLAAAAAAGVSPRKLAKGDASMDKSVAAEEDNSEGESDDDDSDMFDMSQDELKEVFIGNLLPGRVSWSALLHDLMLKLPSGSTD